MERPDVDETCLSLQPYDLVWLEPDKQWGIVTRTWDDDLSDDICLSDDGADASKANDWEYRIYCPGIKQRRSLGTRQAEHCWKLAKPMDRLEDLRRAIETQAQMPNMAVLGKSGHFIERLTAPAIFSLLQAFESWGAPINPASAVGSAYEVQRTAYHIRHQPLDRARAYLDDSVRQSAILSDTMHPVGILLGEAGRKDIHLAIDDRLELERQRVQEEILKALVRSTTPRMISEVRRRFRARTAIIENVIGRRAPQKMAELQQMVEEEIGRAERELADR